MKSMSGQSNIKQERIDKDTKETAKVRKEQIGKQKKNEDKLMKKRWMNLKKERNKVKVEKKWNEWWVMIAKGKK